MRRMSDESNQQVSEQPDQPEKQAAKALSALGASKGGRARASVLSPEERKAIARKAIQTRWAKAKGLPMPDEDQVEQVLEPAPEQEPQQEVGDAGELPFAMFQGKLQIGDEHFAVYVLNNESATRI